MSDHFGPITLKWDPKNLEIRTMSVEKTLEPLVLQVTTLVNTKGPSKKKKGKSKRASALVGTVEKATTNFIEKGEKIAYENPDITAEMLSAVEEVRKTGAAMSIAARYSNLFYLYLISEWYFMLSPIIYYSHYIRVICYVFIDPAIVSTQRIFRGPVFVVETR